MDKIFWFGVLVLILCFVIFLYFVWDAYRNPVVNIDDRNYNFEDEDWPHEQSSPRRESIAQGYEYPCCDHCYDEHGESIHVPELINKHTVPCDEPVGNYHCQEF